MTTFTKERLKSDASGVLTRLETELATLRDELAIWTAEGTSPHAQPLEPEGTPTNAERRQAREQFSAKLQDIWRRKSVSKWGEGEDHFSHYVDFSGELPRLSTRFEYVTELLLTANEPGARIGAFLDSFPNIQCLGVFGIKMEEFPSGIFQMRELSELTLDGCSLKLSEVTVEGLSRIETLTRLNLANNPLAVAPHVGYMAGLTGLMLNNANLSSVPSGIDKLSKLRVVALHENNISDVGYELFEIPDTQDLFVGLLNNPLSDASRQRISHYLESSSMDRKVEIQTEDVVSESDLDSESSESGFSTGSDSD
jgi:Leucine-rich repeat (LRR) protein